MSGEFKSERSMKTCWYCSVCWRVAQSVNYEDGIYNHLLKLEKLNKKYLLRNSLFKRDKFFLCFDGKVVYGEYNATIMQTKFIQNKKVI